MIKKSIHKIRSSEFALNSIKLMTGAASAQIIAFLTAPLLYRLYSKIDYGTLGIYAAISGTIIVFSTLQYAQAILIEKHLKDAYKILRLNQLINLVISAFTAGILLFFKDGIVKISHSESIEYWIYLIPISIFFNGQNDIFRVWCNRLKKYNLLTFNSFLTALTVPIVSISFSVFHGVNGLFIGMFAGQIIPSLILYFRLRKSFQIAKSESPSSFSYHDLIKKYKRFPIYSLPAEFISSFSFQLPTFMFTNFYGVEAVALYSLATKMLGLPTMIISNAIGEVYKQKITEEYNLYGTIRKTYLQTVKILTAISLVFFIFIFLMIPIVFPYIFGAKWNDAILISQIMTVLFFMRFINAPISYIIFLKEKQHIDLILSSWFVISSYFAIKITHEYYHSMTLSLSAFVGNFCLIYIGMIIYNHKLSISNGQKHEV